MAGKGQPFQTQERFIEKSKIEHGDSLDYSRVIYKHSKQKVEFGCKICGHWFKQTPNHNLTGRGCPKCGWKRLSEKMRHYQTEFIDLAIKVHGDKYDYSKTEYVNGAYKITIICKTHKTEFLQSGAMHLKGNGCPQCYEDRRGDAKIFAASASFVSEANVIHGYGTYNYSKVDYKSCDSLVTIGCNKCGEDFLQTPSGHKQGYGCQLCAKNERGLLLRSNTQEFIDKSVIVHGEGKFHYDRVNYKTSLDFIEIGCKSCSRYWLVKATKHLAGFGCSVCANYGFNPAAPSTLYVLKCKDITKIGITNREVSIRAKEVSKDSGHVFTVCDEFNFNIGIDCVTVETKLLDYLRSNYQNPEEKYNGYTESFIGVNYEVLIAKIIEEIYG